MLKLTQGWQAIIAHTGRRGKGLAMLLVNSGNWNKFGYLARKKSLFRSDDPWLIQSITLKPVADCEDNEPQ